MMIMIIVIKEEVTSQQIWQYFTQKTVWTASGAGLVECQRAYFDSKHLMAVVGIWDTGIHRFESLSNYRTVLDVFLLNHAFSHNLQTKFGIFDDIWAPMQQMPFFVIQSQPVQNKVWWTVQLRDVSILATISSLRPGAVRVATKLLWKCLGFLVEKNAFHQMQMVSKPYSCNRSASGQGARRV